jgi:hypothetical protein
MDLLDILILLFKYKSQFSTIMLYYNIFNYTLWTVRLTSKVPVYMYKRITYKPIQEPPEDWEIINETEKSDL